MFIVMVVAGLTASILVVKPLNVLQIGSEGAESLGVSRSSLYQKIRRYGIAVSRI